MRSSLSSIQRTRATRWPTCLRHQGVYVFHGDEEKEEGEPSKKATLPMYIGKSVNLRARVLSHLRNPSEANLLRQTRRISCIRTAGEIGALLLEASLIKQQPPLLNQKLRRNRQLCSWRVADGLPRSCIPRT